GQPILELSSTLTCSSTASKLRIWGLIRVTMRCCPPGSMSCRSARLHRSIDIHRRRNDALTQNPARPTHLPRFGETLSRLISRNRTAAPGESSHRATQAEMHACQRFRLLLMATLRASLEELTWLSPPVAIKRDVTKY